MSTPVLSIILITRWLLNIIVCLWPHSLLRCILLLCALSNFLSNAVVVWALLQGLPSGDTSWMVSLLAFHWPEANRFDYSIYSIVFCIFFFPLHSHSYPYSPDLVCCLSRSLIKTLLPWFFIWGTLIWILYHEKQHARKTTYKAFYSVETIERAFIFLPPRLRLRTLLIN